MKKHMQKRTNIIFVPSKRYQDSRIILQILKALMIVMGFIFNSQRFTEPNYLDVDISFGLFCVVPETKSALLQKSVKEFWSHITWNLVLQIKKWSVRG